MPTRTKAPSRELERANDIDVYVCLHGHLHIDLLDHDGNIFADVQMDHKSANEFSTHVCSKVGVWHAMSFAARLDFNGQIKGWPECRHTPKPT